MKAIYLSPSKLNAFNDCKRCFWISENMSIKPPRGIFPSLPGGMDRVLKQYFDKYRGALPPELEGRVPGVLMKDMAKLKKWRFWRSGLKCFFEKEQVGIGGALDDCLVQGIAGTLETAGTYIPIDNKTKGAKPKDDGAQYYQTQLDCYNLMLRENGYTIQDEGYLVYWYPEEMVLTKKRTVDNELIPINSGLRLGVDIYKLICSADRAKDVLLKAAECLRGPIPAHAGCELCEHVLLRAVKNVAIATEKQEAGNGGSKDKG